MTIQQLARARKHQLASSENFDPREDVFVADGSDLLIVQEGDFFVAIDFRAQRYAAQVGSRVLRGRADVPLSAEEMAILQGN